MANESDLQYEPAGGAVMRERIEQMLADPARMSAVLRSQLLDTEPEDAFDRLTRIAARVTGAPVAFISVIDRDRDFYKSCFGFTEPLASERQLTGRTFCHYAVLSEEPLVIPDARADEHYRHVPTVEALGIAAYLGVPLKMRSGQVIGSFCAVDVEPHDWTPSDVEILSALAESTLREVELRTAMEEAERIREGRARMIQGFSHDLKNPVGAAVGHAELLLEGYLGELEPRQHASVERIRALLRDGLDLIDDLVELARAEAGEIELRPTDVDVRKLTIELVDEYRAQVEAAGLTLACELAAAYPTIRADERRVRQVVGNLLSNAIKYNLNGGRVVLRAEPRERKGAINVGGECIALDVEDTGRGIPEDKHSLLFREFTRLDPEAAPGAGLGLAISRRIARALGGDITFRSTPGEGSTFTLWIPVRSSE